MFTKLATLRLKRAIDPVRGNVQTFLDRLLVEVASENYRYFLSELAAQELEAGECWPPLLSNERQVSGLFAVGLSRVCPVSNPEHPIARLRRSAEDSDDPAKKNKGRIDFLAYYGSRHIALELKRCPISTLGDARTKAGLAHQWKIVSKQSKEALSYMKDPKDDSYDHPVSVGLLVVRVSRKVTSRITDDDARRDALQSLPSIASDIGKLTRADYLSYYVPPPEMQVSYGWGANEDENYVFPGVVFAAVVHGNATASAAS